MRRSAPALIAAFAILALASTATATPISISFDNVRDFEQAGGGTNGVPSGEPSNALGLVLPGQVGPWSSLVVGNGDFADTYSAARSIVVSGGIRFELNVVGDTYQTFTGGGDALRGNVPFLRRTATPDAPATSTSLVWRLSNLTAGHTYNLALFGQLQGGVPVNPTDFAIVGHDAGNGVGAPVTLDGENDGNFYFVAAPGGTITGRMILRDGQEFASWAGLQLEEIPEPGTVVLFGVGLVGLAGCGLRRRRSAT